MQSTRDPYPYPTFENDNSFQGGVFERKQAYGVGEHLIGQRNPWDRLNKTPTLSSARHEVFWRDPMAPNDNLDFVIKSEYNQHGEFLCGSADVKRQRETNGNPDNRVLKNRIVEVVKPEPELGHPLKRAEQKEKKHPCQAKGTIASHHGENTNSGYSRKPCGGNFTNF